MIKRIQSDVKAVFEGANRLLRFASWVVDIVAKPPKDDHHVAEWRHRLPPSGHIKHAPSFDVARATAIGLFLLGADVALLCRSLDEVTAVRKSMEELHDRILDLASQGSPEHSLWWLDGPRSGSLYVCLLEARATGWSFDVVVVSPT